MHIAIEIPEDLSVRLAEEWGDLPQRTLEAVAAQAYRAGALTSYEVQRLLGLNSRWATEEFLKRAGAWLNYTAADLDQDISELRGLGR